MRKIVILFITTIALFSCDDGDLITDVTEIEFDDTFQICDVNMTTQDIAVVYKTRTSPNESLSLQISNPGISIDDLINTIEDPNNPLLEILSNPMPAMIVTSASNVFKFRSYDNDPSNLFCLDIPPANVNVLNEFDATSGGIAQFITTLIKDDEDGIPAHIEDKNLDGDNNPATMPTDTDGDGLPDYIDVDDDGDNVLTINEGVTYTEENGLIADNTDENSTNNPDLIPDYLDSDDDGDGVLTRNEENVVQNNNPTDDISSGFIKPDYLNEEVANEDFIATEFRNHTIKQTFIITLNLENIQFPDVIYDVSTFGNLENNITKTRNDIVPNFN